MFTLKSYYNKRKTETIPIPNEIKPITNIDSVRSEEWKKRGKLNWKKSYR